jgi:hypothetical protein
VNLLESADIDRRLSWPIGRAERLARRGKLPHLVLPDGAIRFRWEQIEPLIRVVDASNGGSEAGEVRHER